MKYNEIKNLLDKYLAGETSQEEEKALNEYFAQPNVHANFEEWQPMFAYFSSEKNLTVSKDFDEKILAKIEQKQNTGKIIQFNWRRAVSVAAAVLLLLGATGIFYKLTDKNITEQNVAQTTSGNPAQAEIEDTFSNPEDAKKAVEHALAFLSTKMNTGTSIAEKGIDKLNVMNKIIITQD
jgi:anti-sigma factor RsiW